MNNALSKGFRKNVVISGVNTIEKHFKGPRKTCRMSRNVVIAGVVISGVKYMARDRKSEGTGENMSDVAECRYSRSRYIRSSL